MTPTTSTALADVTTLDAEHVMGTYGRFPVEFVRGSGTELFDSEGRRYLDFLSGLAVTSLGHAHPAVAAAVSQQASKLLHVSNLFYTEHQAPLAATLDGLLGGGGRCFFVNSGAEANECAIKLARRYGQSHGGPERYHVVSAYGSFHGRTLATLAATGQPQKQETFAPLPSGFRQVAFADLAALEAAMDDRVCAVLLEAVQGEGGVQPAPAEYLRGVRRLCDEREALLIIDEVQTGLGRTGRWFAFEHADIAPDVVTLAKALGNGMPIGACWARRGGRRIQARRSRDDVRGPAAGGERRDRRAGRDAGDRRPGARAHRGGPTDGRARGAARGRRGARGRAAARSRARARVRRGRGGARVPRGGVVVNGVTASALRFAPSLLVSDAEIDEAVAIIGRVLAERSPKERT